ncbi:NPC intracellular cholesterol transporter 2-like [Pectinophora gossypiella]|uniref:NPC intracellular cholesterol transporter 2-like n=1 Tax=Pectinophora gossypiella TaxID=13191 RepID=UPI00214DF5CC|nr:NPC intracellular cholesterol transporter 2-like [Pectinophora gossypiella]
MIVVDGQLINNRSCASVERHWRMAAGSVAAVNRGVSSKSDVAMVPLSVLACFALLALAGATEVLQCAGENYENLSDNVQLSPCKKPPCKLKKGTDQHVVITFTPDHDIEEVKNHVSADVFGVNLPFVGVDGNSVCDKLETENGEKATCPLKAGTKYIYKDSFPVLSFYPTIDVKVHWAITDTQKNKDVTCFEVKAKIRS